MIQRRKSTKIDAHRTEKKLQGRHKRNTMWKQDESHPYSCPGQLSPLTTVSIVKDFLLRQGMDNETWKFTNIKDMYLPCVRTNGSRQSSACLRAVSVPLTPRKGSGQSNGIRDAVKHSTEEQRKKEDAMSFNISKHMKDMRAVPNGSDSRTALKPKHKEPGVWQVVYKKEELFTIPTSSKNFIPLVSAKVSCSEKANKPVSPELVIVNDIKGGPKEASAGKICDFIDEKYFLERSRTNLNARTTDENEENRQATCIQGSRGNSRELIEVTGPHAAEGNCEGKKSGRGSSSRCERALSERQTYEAVSTPVGNEKETVDKSDTVEIKERSISDFEERVERFNEASPLIHGFNQRYPKVRMSLKYLVNHLNHKRMVKKFYGVVDSRRLNANFTPVNVLQGGSATTKKQESLQNRRIKWLTAATDALEVETSEVLAKFDKVEHE